jgi:hypothetical protein
MCESCTVDRRTFLKTVADAAAALAVGEFWFTGTASAQAQPIRIGAPRDGIGVLLVEQNALLALDVSRRAYVMDKGAIAYDGDARTLHEDAGALRRLMGVSTPRDSRTNPPLRRSPWPSSRPAHTPRTAGKSARGVRTGCSGLRPPGTRCHSTWRQRVCTVESSPPCERRADLPDRASPIC